MLDMALNIILGVMALAGWVLCPIGARRTALPGRLRVSCACVWNRPGCFRS
jgi:hypothetical protein